MSSVGTGLVRCAKRRSCYRPLWNAPRTAGRTPTIRDRWARPAGEPAVLFGEQRSSADLDRANAPAIAGMYAATDDVAATIVVVVVVVLVRLLSVVVGAKAEAYECTPVKSAVKSSTVEPTPSEASMKGTVVEASMEAAAAEPTASEATVKATSMKAPTVEDTTATALTAATAAKTAPLTTH